MNPFWSKKTQEEKRLRDAEEGQGFHDAGEGGHSPGAGAVGEIGSPAGWAGEQIIV